jgi:hypothetical protein
MIPLTIPEIKRLLAALTTRPLPRWLVIHWDWWTRRHQARSRWFYIRARLARQPEFAQVKLGNAAALIGVRLLPLAGTRIWVGQDGDDYRVSLLTAATRRALAAMVSAGLSAVEEGTGAVDDP